MQSGEGGPTSVGVNASQAASAGAARLPDALTAPRPARSWAPWLLGALAVAMLAPFLTKPFNIDDPIFVATARQIARRPWDPFGFSMNWYGFVSPMWAILNHPPGAPYFLALAGRLMGWSEPALHSACLLPAAAAAAGVWRLALRFCGRPAVAALIALASPVFVVSGTNVMCDMLLLALWVWAMACWIDGLARLEAGRTGRAWTWMLAAGLLASLAALVKYPGLNLVPLLVVYTLLRRRLGLELLVLALPLIATLACEAWLHRLYGSGPLSVSMKYASVYRGAWGPGTTLRLFNCLTFAGGCFLPALLLWPLLGGRAERWIGLGTLALFVTALPMGLFGAVQMLDIGDELNRPLVYQLALLGTGGVAVLALCVTDLKRRRDADALLLMLWVVGTLVFAAGVNWTINGRTLLPAAPAVAILLARRLGDGGWLPGAGTSFVPRRDAAWVALLAISGLVSLAAAWADDSVARAQRQGAQEMHRMAAAGPTGPRRLWFMGHWGFQHYIEQEGWKALDVHALELSPGDMVAVSLANSGVKAFPEEYIKLRGETSAPVLGWMSLHNGFTGAGFYSSIWGSAPWLIGPTPRENFLLLEMKQPVRGRFPGDESRIRTLND